jgi:hypothetical protein
VRGRARRCDRIAVSSRSVRRVGPQLGLAIGAGAARRADEGRAARSRRVRAFVTRPASRTSGGAAIPSGFTPKRPLALRRMVVGSDICPCQSLRAGRPRSRSSEYGPTETTITSLRHVVGPDDFTNSHPVRAAVANADLHPRLDR